VACVRTGSTQARTACRGPSGPNKFGTEPSQGSFAAVPLAWCGRIRALGRVAFQHHKRVGLRHLDAALASKIVLIKAWPRRFWSTGPGQLVVYPIVDLKRIQLGPRAYIDRIEQVIIDSLATWGITAERTEHTGVWVGDAKVCAIGVNVSRWVTMHGFALNVNCGSEHFEGFKRIVPCGITDPSKSVASIESLLPAQHNTPPVTLEAVSALVQRHFADLFKVDFYSGLPTSSSSSCALSSSSSTSSPLSSSPFTSSLHSSASSSSASAGLRTVSQSTRGFHTVCCPSRAFSTAPRDGDRDGDEDPVTTSTKKGVTLGQIPINDQMGMVFTCNQCDTRAARYFSRLSYEKGVVLVTCPGCDARHLIADNLGWFGDENANIEDIMREHGEAVRHIDSFTMEVSPEDLERLKEGKQTQYPNKEVAEEEVITDVPAEK